MRALLSVLLLGILWPSTAAATPAPYRAPRSPAAMDLSGTTVRNRHLAVRCTSPADCDVVLDMEIVADRDLEVETYVHFYRQFLVDGQELRADDRYAAPLRLSAGQPTQIHLEFATDIRAQTHDDNPFFMVADPLWARHVLLGERSRQLTTARYEAGGMSWAPFTGATLSGPLVVDAAIDDGTELTIDEAAVRGSAQIGEGRVIRLSVRGEREPSFAWVRPGGPMLGLGASLNDPDTRFSMRLGYEFGITDYMIVSGTVESDFERQVTLSLMLEGATPNALFFIVLGLVSVSTGVGAVLEISDQGARGGVRFVSNIQAAPIGFAVTVDYFPDDDDVVMGLMGRVSL